MSRQRYKRRVEQNKGLDRNHWANVGLAGLSGNARRLPTLLKCAKLGTGLQFYASLHALIAGDHRTNEIFSMYDAGETNAE